jgi:hypothetical protein
MNIVNYIRPTCQITLPNGNVVSSDEILVLKNFYKKEIYEKLNGRTIGKVILIWSNNLDVILPAIKAIWELGCAISVHDFSIDVVSHPLFKDFYNHIDLIIGPPIADDVLPNLPHVNALETKMSYVDYENNRTEEPVYKINPENYPSIDYKLDSVVDGDTVCCVTHSSGTTGVPKIIKIDHKTAIELVKENIKIFNFSSLDRVLHYKTLHHGSLFLNYAVPAFFTTDNHYWIVQKTHETVNEFMNRSLDLCVTEKLTKWLIPYRNISNLSLGELKKQSLPNISLITVMGPSESEMKTIFEKYNPTAVYNNFGCTEIGTIAVSVTNSENIDDYRPHVFNHFNSLLDLQVCEENFRVKYKSDRDWKVIGDIISIDNSVLVWHGRNSSLTFNGIKTRISSINAWIKNYLQSQHFALVPDFDINQLYLAVFDDKYKNLTANEINSTLSLSDELKHCVLSKVDFIEFEKVYQGIKPSQPVLLFYFRKL